MRKIFPLLAVCLLCFAGGVAGAADGPTVYLPVVLNASGTAGPTLAGCPLLPPDNIWNRAVDSLPVHSLSDAYVTALGRSRGMHADFGSGEWDGGPIGIPFNLVSAGQARAPVSFYYPEESDPGPYPIPSGALREYGSDHHILTLDQSDCRLYEVYDASPDGDGGWEAGSGAIFDLTSNALRPASWTSADAAGLPLLPGLARYDEVAAGEIRHALRFTANCTGNAYVWPARHRAASCGGGAANPPPMGQRFRLKASFDISGAPPQTRVILRALQTYGMILADNGSSWYVSGAPDERWDNDDLHWLDRYVQGDDFEAVDVSGLMMDPNSGQSR